MITNDTPDSVEDENPEMMDAQFRSDLESLINQYSKENDSDTPDFILAGYMADCLDAFDTATTARETWFGRKITKITFDPDNSPPRALVRLDEYGQVEEAYDCGEDLIAAVGPEEAKLYREYYLIEVDTVLPVSETTIPAVQPP